MFLWTGRKKFISDRIFKENRLFVFLSKTSVKYKHLVREISLILQIYFEKEKTCLDKIDNLGLNNPQIIYVPKLHVTSSYYTMHNAKAKTKRGNSNKTNILSFDIGVLFFYVTHLSVHKWFILSTTSYLMPSFNISFSSDLLPPPLSIALKMSIER